MSKKSPAPLCQLKLPFTRTPVWPRLPNTAKTQCRELLMKVLLAVVVHHEPAERSKHNE